MKVRKLQETGGGTFTISLPKEWLPSNIEKGQKVYLINNENDINLSLEKKKGNQKFVLKSKNNLEIDKRKVVSAYLKDYQKIEIKQIEDPEPLRKFITNNLIGMEVSMVSKDSITCNDLSKPEQLPSENGLRRMKSTISSMMRVLSDNPSDLEKMDNILDKYYILILKQLNLSVEFPQIKRDLEIERKSQIIEYRLMAKSLERFGDHLVNISKNKEIQGDKVNEIKNDFEIISENIFDPDMEEISNLLVSLENKIYNEHDLDRMRCLMIDIGETIMNFSISEENKLNSWT